MAHYGTPLRRVALIYACEHHEREELEQEISLVIWQALPSWDQRASLKTFLFRVAHNRCIDLTRRRPEHHDPLTDDTIDDAPDPERSLTTQQTLAHLRRAILTLPLPQRQALTLSLEDLTHQEIADILGVTPNHVGVLIHRARTALKHHIKEHDS
jgi:RNA polymerase sigma-70 factor (ECF subfamily)